MIDLKLVQKQPEVLAKALADRHSELDVNDFWAWTPAAGPCSRKWRP